MYTPAATIVAAWMSADTGVGPSIASGSQTCNGNCALLPIAPQKINRPAIEAKPPSAVGLAASACPMPANPTVPVALHTTRMPSRNPKSPSRLVRNAFLAASAAEGFSNQNPISR